MSREEIKKWMLESSGFPVTQANAEYLERFQAIAFKAGAASRDAEVAKLINAVADHVTARIELRAQINVLREALEPFCDGDIPDDDAPENYVSSAKQALSSAPEQSLAEYRNKVIEAFVNNFTRHVGGDGEFWLHELQDFAMKEQP